MVSFHERETAAPATSRSVKGWVSCKACSHAPCGSLAQYLNYNHYIPQRAEKHQLPIQVLQRCATKGRTCLSNGLADSRDLKKLR